MNASRLCVSLLSAVLVSLTVAVGTAWAQEAHKVVIQASTGDEQSQTLVLNVASNLQKHYSSENVVIEIVAYGPGLSMLTKSSPMSERVQSLAASDIAFSACANTMKGIAKKTGSEPVLTDGVKITPAGAARIVELQEQGYAYVRP